MATFKVKINSGVYDRSYTFKGSEKDMWNNVKSQFDSIEDFVVVKHNAKGIQEKVWFCGMKNGRITKECYKN